MSSSFLAEIYNGASTIAKPLSISALVSTFFFLLIRQIIVALAAPISKILPKDALRIIVFSLTSFLILSIIALLGGFISYGLEITLKSYVEKEAGISSADTAIARGDPNDALSSGEKIISMYPDEPIGYYFKGTANMMLRHYADAITDFKSERDYSVFKSKCDSTYVYPRANLAAALASNRQIGESKKVFDDISKCKLDKQDQFNFAKVLIEAGDYQKAEDYIASSNLNDAGRPDFRARIYLEKAIVILILKQGAWANLATKELSSALCLDPGLRSAVLQLNPGNGSDPPGGLVEDYGFELRSLGDSGNAAFLTDFRHFIKTNPLCT